MVSAYISDVVMNKGEKMNNLEMAVTLFEEGFSCSQAIISSFSEGLNLDKNTALKIADSFGGGMGGMAFTCGAVTGAFMVIGLKYGRTSASDQKAKQKTKELVREFAEKFKKRNKFLNCNELLNCDISTAEGAKYAKKHNLTKDICPKFVADSAEILGEIL